MPILYNCHTDGDQYRITKFSDLGEVESTYLCSLAECQCPAGHLRICRHRDMLPKFIAQEAVDTYLFYSYDLGIWVTNEPASGHGSESEFASMLEPRSGLLGDSSVDEDETELIEPMSMMGNGTPHLGGVYAKDVTPKPHSPTAEPVVAKAPKIVRRI